MVEVRLAEPALDPDRDRPRFLGRAVGGGERLCPRRELVEGRALDGLARLDDHHARAGARGDRLRERAEQVGLAVGAGGLGRGAHDHEVRVFGLPEDRVTDVGRLAQDGLTPAGDVLLDERGQRALGLGPDRERDPGRDEVEDDDRGVVMSRDRVGEAQGELGVGSAADRHDDPADVLASTLLDDGDVGGRVADDLVDRRRDHRTALAPGGRLAAPAEDDQVRLLLGRRLDDPLGGMPADPDDRVDRGPIRRVIQDPLEQSPGVAGAGRALGQRHPLGHLDDPERR